MLYRQLSEGSFTAFLLIMQHGFYIFIFERETAFAYGKKSSGLYAI